MAERYRSAKVYKITNSVNDEVYVGSTTKLLALRFAAHLVTHQYRPATQGLGKLLREIGPDKLSIELLEDCPCNSAQELRSVERKWVDDVGTLNLKIPSRTMTEYTADNKEALAQKGRDYYDAHKEQIGARMRIYYAQNKKYNRSKTEHPGGVLLRREIHHR